MNKLFINTEKKKSTINKNVYGHFSEHLGRCIYEGLYVGKDSEIPNTNGMRNDVVAALKNIKIPVLRWPGGCFADEYHWKDGIGKPETRKKMVNTHWGGVIEDNSFGTHEFMELCNQLGCEPYVNGNVGSGTVQEMSEWVEYMTFDGLSPMAKMREENGREKPWKLKYFGVGNENWGCGGNMRPEFYADIYRRFQTYVRSYGDNKIYKIACGANSEDYDWTEQVMRIAGKFMNALTLHYYTVPNNWSKKGSATDFSKQDYFLTLKKAFKMEEIVSKHINIMNKYDPDNKIGLIVDEWGTWYDVEPGTNPGFLYQQNTMRDAMVAALTLDIFNSHSDRVVMANIAQTVNVLQAVVLTEGAKMLLTPTYHVFDLYKDHQDATLIDSYIETTDIVFEDISIPCLTSTVSEGQDGLTVTLANLSPDNAYEIDCEASSRRISSVNAKILTGAIDSHNTFDNPDAVKIRDFTDAKVTESGARFTIPPCSVMCLKLS